MCLIQLVVLFSVSITCVYIFLYKSPTSTLNIDFSLVVKLISPFGACTVGPANLFWPRKLA